MYALVGEVTGFEPGLYHYQPNGHLMVQQKQEDLRAELVRATLGQPWVREASLVLVIAANYERTTREYGERGIRYVHIEVGQNVYLQAEALGLGTVMVVAFDDRRVQEVLGIKEHPLAIMPVGRPGR